MFTGVSSILHFISSMTDDAFDKLDEEASDFLEILRTPGEEKTDDYKEIVMALVVAVYFLVLARRRSPGPATENTNTESTSTPDESRKMDKKTFSEMRQTALSSLGLSPTDKRHGEDVDAWIALIMDQKWAKGQEWFDNIPSVGQRGDDFLDENGHGLEDEDPMEASTPKRRRTKLFAQAGNNKEGVLLPGLGTMMQDRVDYLSEDRREDYLEWKADMMKRIARMDRSAGAVGRKASVKKQAVAA
jgi:origin recognition complex subunit 6